MNKAYSLYLDLIRGGAALVVVFYHYSNQVANGSWAHSFPKIGQEAVILFFVLSGYVITYAADQREKTAVEFICKRVSRVYSVYLPSLAVVYLCWFIITSLGKVEVYNPGESLTQPWKVLGLNLTFLNFNSVFPRVVPPGGGPYWSLTYEVFYYFLFVLFTYFRHPVSWGLICLSCLFIGAGPVLLFPIWLLGSFIYKVQLPGYHRTVFVVSVLALVVGYVFGIRDILGDIGDRFPYRFSPHYTSDFLYFYLVGFLVAMNLLAARDLLAEKAMPRGLVTRPIRLFAGVSFSLYLMHLPLMRLGEALMGDSVPYLLPLLVAVLILITCRPIENSNRIVFRYLYSPAQITAKLFGGVLRRSNLMVKNSTNET